MKQLALKYYLTYESSVDHKFWIALCQFEKILNDVIFQALNLCKNIFCYTMILKKLLCYPVIFQGIFIDYFIFRLIRP